MSLLDERERRKKLGADKKSGPRTLILLALLALVFALMWILDSVV